MKYDPWYKTTLTLPTEGRLRFDIPHDLFSTIRIDEGTLLLLENLPDFSPKNILDMGCGYGALGLPIAAKFPNTRIEMVDRDLLAVAWAAKNAEHNHLTNVLTHGSLGYRDLAPSGPKFDWILCNVPARIGRPFIKSLLKRGRDRLTAQGELRIVVIRDLAPEIVTLGKELGFPILENARGPRHVIFSLSSNPESPEKSMGSHAEDDDLYFRDSIEFDVGVGEKTKLRFDRPFDLGGDDPKRLTSGLPVLRDALPRSPLPQHARVFCFRIGYGILPLLCRTRWPEGHITAVDRDLLAATFTRRNADKLGLSGAKLEISETAHFPDFLASLESKARFDLILGELSPSAGEKVLQSEIKAIAQALAPGGQALLLALSKIEREWVKPFAAKNKLAILPVISREGYVVLRLTSKAV